MRLRGALLACLAALAFSSSALAQVVGISGQPAVRTTPAVIAAAARAVSPITLLAPVTAVSVYQPARLLIAGPPGSGKTTYGKRIAREFGVVHISAGELLRERAKTDPALASVMSKGDLVDTALVLRAVQERLSQPDVQKNGFILDGFPRRMDEAAPLREWLAASSGIDAMIRLEVPEAELRRRILARGRADDTLEIFKNRMKIYQTQTRAAEEFFDGKTRVLTPAVTGSDPEKNYAAVSASLKRLLAR